MVIGPINWNAQSILDITRRTPIMHIPPSFTAIAITETKFDPQRPAPNIASFPYSCHRPLAYLSGGVSLYSRIPLRERRDLYHDCDSCLFAEMAGPAGVNT